LNNFFNEQQIEQQQNKSVFGDESSIQNDQSGMEPAEVNDDAGVSEAADGDDKDNKNDQSGSGIDEPEKKRFA
jgi:hypothetical protein